MNTKLMPLTWTTLGLAVGAAAGYFLATKRLETKYAALAQVEIEEAQEYFSKLNKVGDYSDPETVLQRRHPDHILTKDEMAEEREGEPELAVLEAVVDGLRYATPPSGVLTSNVFRNRGPVRQINEEPYVISEDEYMAGEKDYAQVTLTYYAGDDVLAEADDMPLEDVEATVGNDNLERFGHKSSDPNTLHIRNERLEIDYEIVRSRGHYAIEVGGFVEEKKRPGKMRKE